jgi:hypothetical protein
MCCFCSLEAFMLVCCGCVCVNMAVAMYVFNTDIWYLNKIWRAIVCLLELHIIFCKYCCYLQDRQNDLEENEQNILFTVCLIFKTEHVKVYIFVVALQQWNWLTLTVLTQNQATKSTALQKEFDLYS